ncbi:hypothetical protein PS893_03582 [Pseudomonas fluorescens]|nr:hypothetical protein PS893_03582 [Pseudomonas fluorescens]
MTRLPTLAMVAVLPAVKVPATPSMVKFTTLTGPSTLEVPVNTLPVKAVSSRVETVSLASVKLSLTGVTLMVRVEVTLLPEPSVTV